ncbi:MAG TPA: extracellular solute-binding protein [Candidatus Atribacteria bacterium]|nr:MAG: carbohydrate ABC transporter substrate-binding protein [Candidatus Nealsonbacteria bacterium]HDK28100.1 extracellular solute-binding protein [Candidatus Atribacteria bacterium]
MLKKLIYLVTALVFVASISICTFAQEKEIELTVLNYLDITSPEAKTWDATLEAFYKEYPNIKLKIENLFGEAYHQKLRALAAAGNLPDVMYLWPGGRSAEIYKNELTEDLYPYLSANRARFVPVAVAPQWEGKLYELPIATTATHVVYANTKLLKDLGLAMPKTYDELVAMVPKIKEAGLDPIIMPNKASWVMQSCLFSALVGRIGGQEWLEKAIAGEASFTDQEFVDSLKLVKDLYDTGLLPPSSIQLEYGDGPNLFASGKGVFMIDGDWRVNALIPLLSEEEQKDITLTVFPDIPDQDGKSGSTSTVAATGFGMKAGLPKEKAKAAWKWIYFFAGPKASEIRLVDQGMISSYRMKLEGYDLPPLAKKRGAFYAIHSGTYVLDDKISGEPINILNIGLQGLALGNITPEKLAADFEAAMKEIR